MTAFLAAVALLAAGYVLGRWRPAPRILHWAEGRSERDHGPGWWLAQAVGVAALAWVWTVHPRRSAANRRSWREAQRERIEFRGQFVAAPERDPDWAAKRAAEREEQP